MYGWTGSILRVDLTEGSVVREPLHMDRARAYMGLQALASAYWQAECARDAGAADNRLVLMTGPLTGLLGPCTCRYAVVTRSPASGEIAGGSFGGHLGAELKLAGYDGIVVQGAAERPAYLRIVDGTAELRPAEDIWGKDVDCSDRWLRERCLPGAGTLVTGGAAENGCAFSVAVGDRIHVPDCPGLGAVMGAKKLKGIVVSGSGSLSVSSPEDYLAKAAEARQAVLDMPFSVALGSASVEVTLDLMENLHTRPAEGYRAGARNADWNAPSGGCAIAGRRACYSCPVGCRKIVQSERWSGVMEGMAPENIRAFSRFWDARRLEDHIRAHNLCRTYGMAPTACAEAVDAWMRLAGMRAARTEKPLGREDTETVLRLIEDIGTGRGDGRGWCAGAPALAKDHPESFWEKDAPSVYDRIPALTPGDGKTAVREKNALAEACGICPLAAAALDAGLLRELLEAAVGPSLIPADIDQAGGRIRAFTQVSRIEGGAQ